MMADLRRGALVGLLTGALFATWAFLVWSGAGDGPFKATGTSLRLVVMTYLTTGFVAGILVGGLWRSAHTAVACYLIATPAAAAIALGIILMTADGWTHWDFETQSLFGVLVGIATLVIGNQINVKRRAQITE
jgi:hypothetical protein